MSNQQQPERVNGEKAAKRMGPENVIARAAGTLNRVDFDKARGVYGTYPEPMRSLGYELTFAAEKFADLGRRFVNALAEHLEAEARKAEKGDDHRGTEAQR